MRGPPNRGPLKFLMKFPQAQFVLVLGSLVLGLLTWFATEFTRRLGIHVGEAVQ